MTGSIFSKQRILTAPNILPVKGLEENKKQKMDGLKMLDQFPDDSIPLVFFDPQYRSVLDKQKYGNEGERQKGRATMKQMEDDDITCFACKIKQKLMPSGHLALWVDKFLLCNGVPFMEPVEKFMDDVEFRLVDMITWDKGRFGMGYRSRRQSEFLLIYQKEPVKAKGVWVKHNIPDVWSEKIPNANAPHVKPHELQKAVIESVTNKWDVVVDPAAGSYSVMYAAIEAERNFVGCDII